MTAKQKWWNNLTESEKEAQRQRSREACRKSALKHAAKIQEYRKRYRLQTKEQRRIRDAEKHKQIMADPLRKGYKRALKRALYHKTMDEVALQALREHRHKREEANPEVRQRMIQWRRKYYAEHKESINAKSKAWRAKNRDKRLAAHAKRRALKKAAAITLKGIQAFMTKVLSNPTAICYYCEKRLSTRDIHFDHIVPLGKGGPHSADNLCVSCEYCNCSKHDKPLSVWIKTRVGQQLLNL